jgi:hypothetical protein
MYTAVCGSTDGLLIADTMPAVNTLMKIGGFSSRRLHLVSFGRPIVAYGSLAAYKNICKLVEQIKFQISNTIKNKKDLQN